MFPKVPQSSLACFKVLITYELLNIKYSGDVALFEEVGDVVHMDAASDAYCEDNEYYIPSTIT